MAFVILLIIVFILWKFRENIKNWLKNIIIKLLIWIVVIVVAFFAIKFIINNFVFCLIFTIVGLAVVWLIGYIATIAEKKQEAAGIQKWLATPLYQFSENQIEKLIKPFGERFFEEDKNTKAKFDVFNIPFGRVGAFLNYFDTDINVEEPYFYSPIRSKSEIELREYGAVLTNGGLYINKQLDYQDSNKEFKVKQFDLHFSGMWNITGTESCLVAKNVNGKKTIIMKEETTLPLPLIQKLCQQVINSGLSLSLYKETIVDDFKNYEPLDSAQAEQPLDEKFKQYQNTNDVNTVMETTGVMRTNVAHQIEYELAKNNMNQIYGHGTAAEYGNTVIDRLIGKDPKWLGSNNETHGADRNVGGINIQTKYCKTASDSIGSAFDKGKAIYKNPDGSMMQIEVPRDQYQDALKSMQKRIDNGEVPGAKPGDDPKKYVRKGRVTYHQAEMIAKPGTIESLSIDLIDGVILSTTAGGITAIITFANAVWNGAELKEAAKIGIITGVKVLGKGALIYTSTMQLTRFGSLNEAVKKINASAVAKSSLGKKLGLNNLTSKKLVSGGVIVAITFGPDICRALVGRISPQQLFKNSAIGIAGIGGAAVGGKAVGAALGSVVPGIGTVVGAMVGGVLTGIIAKKVLDQFIEDDAKEMYQIMKEEFIDVVMQVGLSKEEFERIVQMTFQNEKLPHIFRDMYAYGDARAFARNHFVSNAVIEVLKDRQIITKEMIESGYNQYFDSLLEKKSELVTV